MLRIRPRQSGFTIIELMIAVVVVGVLVALAYPSYLDSIRKGRRADAAKGIAAVLQAQERFRSNNPSFGTTLAALGLTSAVGGSYYDVAVSDTSATGHTATATAKNGSSQVNDTNCVRMRVVAAAGNLTYGSAAATGEFDNSDAARCWAK